MQFGREMGQVFNRIFNPLMYISLNTNSLGINNNYNILFVHQSVHKNAESKNKSDNNFDKMYSNKTFQEAVNLIKGQER